MCTPSSLSLNPLPSLFSYFTFNIIVRFTIYRHSLRPNQLPAVLLGLPPYSSPLSLSPSLMLQRYPSHVMSIISIHVFPSNVIQCLACQNIEYILAYRPSSANARCCLSDLKPYTLFLQYSLFLCMPNPNPILIQPFVCLARRFFNSFPIPLFLHSHLESTNAATKTPPPEPKKTPLTPSAAAQTPCSNAKSKQPVKNTRSEEEYPIEREKG
jgi:hypothetical protein